MNNMTTSDGEIKSLVKIIRNESIGSLPWNSAQTNDWTSASLKTYLNGDWYTSNLTNYDDLIESIVWNLGGYYSPNPTITASEFYTYERGTIVYSGRTTTWSGKVALMYPSDYGYATNGGDTGRDVCLSTQLYNWSSNSDCYSNDFLYLVSCEWQLSPYSPDSVGAYHVAGSNICSDYSRNYHEARPSLYLKSDTQILSGDGTSDSPWIIGEDSVK
jgi:hypothetical protein